MTSNKISPSINHSNKKKHNWLLYEQADKYLIEYIPFYKGLMFDLGCGEAPFKEFFTNYVDNYIGVDWNETYHESKADVIADLNKPLPIENDIANTVVSLNVLEHLYNPQGFINECYRIMNNDATLILHIPFQWHIHEAPHDYFRYTPYGLRYLLDKAGFTDIKVQPTAGFFTTILLKLNYFSLRLIKGSEKSKKLKTKLLTPIWYLNQKTASYLDSKHRGWSVEAQSFFVLARKRKSIDPYSYKTKNKIIASLTTYGSRINTVHITLKSLINQNYKADKIILWLAENEFNLDNIPNPVRELHDNKKIEVRFYKDIKSYKKLIPTLINFPNEIIITFDDDVIYNESLIETLYREHLSNPELVLCGRGHKILFDKQNKIKPYQDWLHNSNDFMGSYDIFPTGVGGVLYPPNCFYKDICNEKKFMELAPAADDVWFKAMTVLANRKSKVINQKNMIYSMPSEIKGTQANALWKSNLTLGKNNDYIKSVFSYYNIDIKKLFKLTKKVTV